MLKAGTTYMVTLDWPASPGFSDALMTYRGELEREGIDAHVSSVQIGGGVGGSNLVTVDAQSEADARNAVVTWCARVRMSSADAAEVAADEAVANIQSQSH